MHTLILSAILFATGLMAVIIKRNAIMVLIGIELMLNAANLNLVVFNKNNPSLSGQFLALFVIVVAVCEAAVGLAIVLRVYKYYQTSVPDQVHELKD
ncbi:MAG: NADH-quinone oxidoreductase subunit NuoK [Cyclobacteriaceae bacterium]